MASDNNGQTHGYAWPDGTVRTAKYEPGVRAIVKNDNDGISLNNKPYEPLRVTPELLSRAYADWLKEYTAWKQDMAAWRERNVKR